MQELGSKDTYINDRLFHTFDADGSGSIDCNEFTLGLTSLWNTSLKERAYTHMTRMCIYAFPQA